MDGWIKIHRKLLEWEWMDDPPTLAVWMYILIHANIADIEWRGIVIPRGSFVTSVARLAKDLRLTSKQVRVRLARLQKSDQIIIQGANRYTMLTVCKYDDYQLTEENKGQTKGKQKGNERASKRARCSDGVTDYRYDSYKDAENQKGKQKGNERASKRATKEEYITTSINTSSSNNNLSLSYQGGMGGTAGDPAREKERIFIFFFLKFGTCAAEELTRFWEHYESQGWRKSNGMAVTDRVALAKTWAKKSESVSKIPEPFLKSLAPVLKADPDAAALSGIRAVVPDNGTLQISATERATEWLEGHIMEMAPTLRRAYGKGVQIVYNTSG